MEGKSDAADEREIVDRRCLMDAPATSDKKPYTDPVCGMKVAADPEKSVRLGPDTYYFCSLKCRDRFNADPHQYLHRHAAA